MITDRRTNFLYLADSLPRKYPDFYERLSNVLNERKVSYDSLPGTKDVWAVDYMPIQVTANEFVQFNYNPDYLRNSVKWSRTISDVDSICKSIGVSATKSQIVLDGGNLVRNSGRAIMCDKIFAENPSKSKKGLIKELRDLLQLEDLIIVPTDPEDFTGHADGIVRFYDSETVLINDYSSENICFSRALESALSKADLNIIKVPYNPSDNDSIHQANGSYINFLEMENLLILPLFHLKEDETAIRLFEKLYEKTKISTIDSNEIADEGGVLNCISWNIRIDDSGDLNENINREFTRRPKKHYFLN